MKTEASTLHDDNGLATNGLATNGLATNGLATNGLNLDGLNSDLFIGWFNQDPLLGEMVMRYVVACAIPQYSKLTWTNPVTQQTYKWNGNLGLTPGWAAGAPATEFEQQLISACLAAHTNKYGVNVSFSFQGLKSNGHPVPVGWGELYTFNQREGCFFGNLFRDEGVFAGSDSTLPSTKSSVRACGLDAPGADGSCAPIQRVGSCSSMCYPDPQHSYFLTCSHNGKLYPAATTRIKPSDVYVCGDGVCQVSESCGTGHTPDNCVDCGPCP